MCVCGVAELGVDVDEDGAGLGNQEQRLEQPAEVSVGESVYTSDAMNEHLLSSTSNSTCDTIDFEVLLGGG